MNEWRHRWRQRMSELERLIHHRQHCRGCLRGKIRRNFFAILGTRYSDDPQRRSKMPMVVDGNGNFWHDVFEAIFGEWSHDCCNNFSGTKAYQTLDNSTSTKLHLSDYTTPLNAFSFHISMQLAVINKSLQSRVVSAIKKIGNEWSRLSLPSPVARALHGKWSAKSTLFAWRKINTNSWPTFGSVAGFLV